MKKRKAQINLGYGYSRYYFCIGPTFFFQKTKTKDSVTEELLPIIYIIALERRNTPTKAVRHGDPAVHPLC